MLSGHDLNTSFYYPQKIVDRSSTKDDIMLNSHSQLLRTKYLNAGNPASSAAVLDLLAEDCHPAIRARVAENINVPLRTLIKLVGDKSEQVRLSASFNDKLPEIFQFQLANDPHEDVRFSLAEDPNTAVEILRILAEDSNVYVKDRAQKTIDSLSSNREKLAA